jgi:hypothetical protein
MLVNGSGVEAAEGFLRCHHIALDFLAWDGGLYFAKNAKTLARLSVRHSMHPSLCILVI